MSRRRVDPEPVLPPVSTRARPLPRSSGFHENGIAPAEKASAQEVVRSERRALRQRARRLPGARLAMSLQRHRGARCLVGAALSGEGVPYSENQAEHMIHEKPFMAAFDTWTMRFAAFVAAKG